jgi:hypothetical protein
VIAKPRDLETRTRPILRLYRQGPGSLHSVIPEIDIWRAASDRFGQIAERREHWRSHLRLVCLQSPGRAV